MSDEFCVNCTRTFKPGEPRYRFGNDVVCEECALILQHGKQAPQIRRDQALSAAAASTRGRVTRRPKQSSGMPIIVTLIVTALCSSIVGWLFYTGKLSLTKEAKPENPNVARFNTLIDQANAAATQGKDDVAIAALDRAIRLLDEDPELQANTDRASLVVQREKLVARSGKGKPR